MISMYFILGMINLVVLGLLLYQYWKETKKKSYAIILNKNGEKVSDFKINPSYNKVEHKYEGKPYSYLLPENTSFVKFKNYKLYFWEFNKTEPLNLLQEIDTKMTADVFNELLLMAKIKALNEDKTSIFDGIDKKYLFIGAVLVILAIMYFTGGF